MTKEEEDGCAVLMIDGAMTIENAEKLRNELVECVKDYEGIIIDMKSVSECDVTGMQLIWSAKLSAENSRKSFRINRASKAALDAFARAGLNPVLMSPFKEL